MPPPLWTFPDPEKPKKELPEAESPIFSVQKLALSIDTLLLKSQYYTERGKSLM